MRVNEATGSYQEVRTDVGAVVHGLGWPESGSSGRHERLGWPDVVVDIEETSGADDG